MDEGLCNTLYTSSSQEHGIYGIIEECNHKLQFPEVYYRYEIGPVDDQCTPGVEHLAVFDRMDRVNHPK
jgi:hypothetical protein